MKPIRSRLLAWNSGLAWIAGLASTLVPTCTALRAGAFDSSTPWLAEILFALAAILVALLLLVPREPGPVRCAAAAGAGAGVLVGIALAQHTPTSWFMSDVAWHTAKVTLTAAGRPLEDPILRAPTIYPFLFHLAAALPVVLGCSVRAVMWAVTPIALSACAWAYWTLARAFLTPLNAAWTAIALPLVFYAPTSGFAFLPNPFNASLAFVFAGLGLLARGVQTLDRRALTGAGLALGIAGLLWYGHLPWLVASTIMLSVRRPRAWLPIAIGATPAVVFLALHCAWLAHSGSLGPTAVVQSAASETTSDRLLAMGRNLMSLSGGARLSKAPGWIGASLIALLAVAFVRRQSRSRASGTILWSTIAAVAVVLIWAGLEITYWQPFSWRYAFLLDALLLIVIGAARPLRMAGRDAPPVMLASLVALWWGPVCALPHLQSSLNMEQIYESSGVEIVHFLETHTSADQPVFASVDTWDRAIGCCVPRPNLVARNGGNYNFAPAAVVDARWKDYVAICALDDPRAIESLLHPYGFRYAVLRPQDAFDAPGFRALAEGFEVVLANDDFTIVDLSRPKS